MAEPIKSAPPNPEEDEPTIVDGSPASEIPAADEPTQAELAALAEQRRAESVHSQLGGGVDMAPAELSATRDQANLRRIDDIRRERGWTGPESRRPQPQTGAFPSLAERKQRAEGERQLFLDSWRARELKPDRSRWRHEQAPDPDKVLQNFRGRFNQVFELLSDDQAYRDVLEHEKTSGEAHPLKEAVRRMAGADGDWGSRVIDDMSPDPRATEELYRWLRNAHYDQPRPNRQQLVRFMAAAEFYNALVAAGNSAASAAKWMMMGSLDDEPAAAPVQLFRADNEPSLSRLQRRGLQAMADKIDEHRRQPEPEPIP